MGKEEQLHDFLHSTADRSKRPATWLSRFTLTETTAGMRSGGQANLRASPDVVALVRRALALSVADIT
jgi:hypothetical protein